MHDDDNEGDDDEDVDGDGDNEALTQISTIFANFHFDNVPCSRRYLWQWRLNRWTDELARRIDEQRQGESTEIQLDLTF